jgi:glycosyltransferase involved in cell wall biosynthesis
MPDNKSMVSVVIPTYNRQDLIMEAVQSVLDQVYEDFELIVVDNASSDKTLDRLQGIKDPRVKIFVESRRGAAFARNTGIAHAQGQFLAFLDSDDLWLPEKLSVQMDEIQSLPAGSIVFSQYSEFFNEQQAVKRALSGGPLNLSVITMLIRTEDFRSIGSFDESLQVGEFLEWYARATNSGMNISKLDTVLSLRRIHPGNSVANARQAKDYLEACRTIINLRRKG